jgi:hypothetical protein
MKPCGTRFLILFAVVCVGTLRAQQTAPQSQQTSQSQTKESVGQPGQPAGTVVFSGVSTKAHIADPNERVAFNGQVMRMADFVAAVSSGNEAVQRLRNPEKHNREKDQPTQPSQP